MKSPTIFTCTVIGAITLLVAAANIAAFSNGHPRSSTNNSAHATIFIGESYLEQFQEIAEKSGQDVSSIKEIGIKLMENGKSTEQAVDEIKYLIMLSAKSGINFLSLGYDAIACQSYTATLDQMREIAFAMEQLKNSHDLELGQ